MIFKKIYLLVLSILSINLAAMDGLTSEQLNSLWDIVLISKIELNSHRNADTISRGDYTISNNNLYACTCTDNELYYFNIETNENKTILFTHKILCFAFTPNNKYIICALENSEVIIWDIENWKLHQRKIIDKPIKKLICPSNYYFAIITKENIIFIDIESGEINTQIHPNNRRISDESDYTDLTFSPNGLYFAVNDDNKISIIWPISCKFPIVHIGNFLGFSDDSEWIFIRREHNELFCQNIKTKCVKILNFDKPIERIISNNNRLIVITKSDETFELTICLYNILTSEKQEIFSTNCVDGSSFSLINSKLIIVIDQTLKILDIDTLQIINTIKLEGDTSFCELNQTFINYAYTDYNNRNLNFVIYKIIDPNELTQEQQILLHTLKRDPRPLLLNEEQQEVFKTLPLHIQKLYDGKIRL